MNSNSFTPNTAQPQDLPRFPELIRTWMADNPSPTLGITTEKGPPEPKCIQLGPRSLSVPRAEVTCCSPSTALSWVAEITGSALAGDESSRHLLAYALQHYLAAVRRERLP